MREGISRGCSQTKRALRSGTFATFRTENKTPEQIGTPGALQVFIDTILLCTITALCMLVSPCVIFPRSGAFGVFACFGAVRRAFCRRMRGAFRVCTVLAWSCYGMDALLYLLPKKRRGGKENIHGVFGVFLL